MFLLFLICLIAGLYFLGKTGSTPAPRTCPDKHSWVVRFNGDGDKRGYLICKVCGKIPGED